MVGFKLYDQDTKYSDMERKQKHLLKVLAELKVRGTDYRL